MKKSLLALALLGTFAGTAFAQTNVTIYGIADVGIQRSKSDLRDTKWEVASGIWSGSRLGFKGSEDLGGGLSAIFTLENGFNIDNGGFGDTTRLFNRQAWVGLNGGFGAVKIGRQYTPMHLAVDSIDPFATGLAGNMYGGNPAIAELPLFSAGRLTVTADDAISTDLRVDNSISYATPNFGGFSAQAIYGLGEAVGTTSANRQFGFSAGYNNGPINAVLAYHNSNAPTPAAGDSRSIFVGGVYDFGVAKAHLGFQDNKLEVLGEEGKARSYMVGASVPLGAGTILASYIRGDDRDSDDQADQFAIGYTHSLSKRTNLYTSLGRNKYEVSGVDLTGNVFNVGLRHAF